MMIVGATAIPPNIAPAFDGVIDLNGSCTGTLLSTGVHILTAAHCVSQNEEQILNLGSPTSGQYRLRFAPGPTGVTGFIQWNANANQIETALEGIAGIDDVEVFNNPDGNAATRDFRIEFRGSLALTDVDQLTIPAGSNTLDSTPSVTTDIQGGIDTTANVTFELDDGAGGVTPITITAGLVTVHPDYDGQTRNGNDIAVLTLNELAPYQADRYGIYVNTNEVGQTYNVAGYGRTGVGLTGETAGSGGVKRSGQNQVGANANGYLNGGAGPLGLVADFDDGTGANDTLGDGTGLGAVEAATGAGDSGSAMLIGTLIAGINSFTPGDGDGMQNNFGDVDVFTRVSAFAGFINDVLDDPIDLVVNMANQNVVDGLEDTVIVRQVAGNFEVVIDSVVAYSEAVASVLSFEILGSTDSDNVTFSLAGAPAIPVEASLGGDDDTVTVNSANGFTFNLDGNDGADTFIANFVGAGTSTVNVTDDDGVSNVEVNLTSAANAVAIEGASVTLGGETVTLSDLGEAGTSFFVTVNGLGASDTFNVAGATQQLGSDVVTQYTFNGGGGMADRLVLNDQLSAGDLDYEIVDDSPFVTGSNAGHVQRTGAPLYVFRNNVEQLELNAGVGSNNFEVTPSADTQYTINANLPVNPLPPGVPGDSLEIEFDGTTTPQLTFTNQALGNGRWEFGNREDVIFTSIEKFNFFDVVALGSDAGSLSQPLVHVINAENGLPVSPAFLAYAATYQQGVRVAMGDMTGDGIPEVITAPGRSHAPTVKVFDILSGAELTAYRTEAYAPTFINGVMLAVGDVDGDGKNDIVTAPSRGASEIKVFRNDTGAVDPIVDAPYRWFHAFPASFIGGSSLALGNVNDVNVGQEIVVGSGSGMRATVRAFDTTMFAASASPLAAPPVFREYLPFEATFRGGVTVAVGQALGDATPDIIVGAGAGGGGRIQILNGDFGGVPLAGNFVTRQMFNDQGLHSPVRVALSDVDNDGIVEVLAAQATDGRSGNIVRRYKVVDDAIDSIFQETDARFTGLFLGSALGA